MIKRVTMAFGVVVAAVAVLPQAGDAVVRPAPILHMPHTKRTERLPQTFAADGAYCWFGDPRAGYTHATRDRVFYGWLTRLGDVQVAQYDRVTHSLSTFTAAYGIPVDDHSNPSLISLPDGRLMVFWTGHAAAWPIHYRISTNPESVLTWGPDQTVDTTAPGRSTYTYPNPVLVGSRLYLFWRAGGGDVPITDQDTAVTWTDDLGGTWAPGQLVFHNPGERPYTKVVADGHGGIFIATTDGHPDEVTVNNVYFARLFQGSLYKADGTLIRSLNDGPAPPATLDLVHSQAATGAEGWTWDIAAAADGTPVITLVDFPSRSAHRYRYATFDGTAWHDRVVVENAGPAFDPDGHQPSYSGGVVLDHDNPNIVYLSRQVNGVFEVERRTTTDAGVSWSTMPITQNSTRNNVRPFVVDAADETGAAAVLWMAGDYHSYVDYHTAIVGYTDLAETRTIARLRTSIEPATVQPHGATVVGARLVVDSTGKLLTGQPLELWVRMVGSTSWKHLANGRTDAEGLAEWTRHPSGNAVYEVRYRGAAGITPASGPRQLVTVSGSTAKDHPAAVYAKPLVRD